jgi:hypothetical protein
MMRTVVVSTLVGMLVAVAASAVYVRIAIGDLEEQVREARLAAMNAREDVYQLEKRTNQSTEFATSQSSAAMAEVAGFREAMPKLRAEFDEMQTQIRLLKLIAR